MRKFLRFQVLAVLNAALLLLAPMAVWAAPAPSPLLGQEAPPLSGQGSSGRLINLQQFRREVAFLKGPDGKLIMEKDGRYKTQVTDYVIVLNFFATYCAPCVREIPTFNKIAASYPGQPIRFLYVNVDVEKSPAEVRAFAQSKAINVEMMFPSVSFATKTYHIDTLPRIVVIDAKGKVHTVITGFQENLAAQLDGILKPLLPVRNG